MASEEEDNDDARHGVLGNIWLRMETDRRRSHSHSRGRSRSRSPSPSSIRASKRRRIDPVDNGSPTARRIIVDTGPREDVPGQQGVQAAAAGPDQSGSLTAMADVGLRDELAYALGRLEEQPAPLPAMDLDEMEPGIADMLPPPPRIYRSTCWWCDHGNPDYDAANDDGSKGYSMAIEFMSKNMHLPYESLAVAAANICEQQLYRPAYEAAQRAVSDARMEPDDMRVQHRARAARRALESLHRPTVSEILRHLQHSLNPDVKRLENLRTAEYLSVVAKRHLRDKETGDVDTKRMDAARQCLKLHDDLNEKMARHAASNGVRFDITLDMARVTALGDQRALEPYLLRNANTLGGSTAAGSSAELATAQERPAFGAIGTLDQDDITGIGGGGGYGDDDAEEQRQIDALF